MGRKNNVPSFGKVKVRFPKNPDGTLGRVQFEHDFAKHEQTEVSVIIERMFLEGVAVLVQQCRHAKRELSIAFAKRSACGNYNPTNGLCDATEKTCDMACELVVSALNEYRTNVNAEVSHESGVHD